MGSTLNTVLLSRSTGNQHLDNIFEVSFPWVPGFFNNNTKFKKNKPGKPVILTSDMNSVPKNE